MTVDGKGLMYQRTWCRCWSEDIAKHQKDVCDVGKIGAICQFTSPKNWLRHWNRHFTTPSITISFFSYHLTLLPSSVISFLGPSPSASCPSPFVQAKAAAGRLAAISSPTTSAIRRCPRPRSTPATPELARATQPYPRHLSLSSPAAEQLAGDG